MVHMTRILQPLRTHVSHVLTLLGDKPRLFTVNKGSGINNGSGDGDNETE